MSFQAGREPLLQECLEYCGLEDWTLEAAAAAAAAAADSAVVVLAALTAVQMHLAAHPFVTRSAA